MNRLVLGLTMVLAATAGARPAPADDVLLHRVEEAARQVSPQVVQWRRDFHAHPELSNREERTSRVIAEKLRALGFDEIRTGVSRYGIVALLKGAQPGAVVAIRADMDALPIEETLDVPYKSRNQGVKHA